MPAFLYYLGLLMSVHFEAKRLGLSGLSKENIPDAMKVIREQGHLVIPLVVLIALMFAGYTPLYAAVIAIFATIGASWIRKETRMTWSKIIEATVEGAKGAISLNMGYLILNVINNDNIYVTGLLVMIMSTILGMGVPGVAAYVIVQAVAVPVLIKAGVLAITSHLFCLIYACLSNITPPVAMSAYVASGIAGSDQTKTGLWAVRLGLIGFIIPFFFLDNPVLLIGAGYAVSGDVYRFCRPDLPGGNRSIAVYKREEKLSFSCVKFCVSKRLRKTVPVCYSMDSFAYGFETRGCAPQTVSP